MVSLIIFLLACGSKETNTSTLPTDGGSCTYEEYSGVCIYQGSGIVTFTGSVNGEDVSFEGNEISLGPEENEPAVGTEIPCTISYITQGTCTPCLLDIGSCGSQAFGELPQ